MQDLERNIKTAQNPERPLHIADLQIQETDDIEDKGMTGSVTELSMNDKMVKPMLPPIDNLYPDPSINSTRN